MEPSILTGQLLMAKQLSLNAQQCSKRDAHQEGVEGDWRKWYFLAGSWTTRAVAA